MATHYNQPNKRRSMFGQQVERRLDTIQKYQDAVLDPDVLQRSDELTPYEDIRRYQETDSMGMYIRLYIQDEYHARQTGKREEPLCECTDPHCPPKNNGELPHECRPRHGAPEGMMMPKKARVYKYAERHPDIIVTEAMESWLNIEARVLTQLSEAMTFLADHVEQDRSSTQPLAADGGHETGGDNR